MAVFEFMAFGTAGNPQVHKASAMSSFRILGIFEIIAGLFNMISLICGIILLINLGNEERR